VVMFKLVLFTIIKPSWLFIMLCKPYGAAITLLTNAWLIHCLFIFMFFALFIFKPIYNLSLN